MGEVEAQLKWNWKKINNKHKEDTRKLRGLAFSLRPRAKTEGKYFTSDMRITSIVIFYSLPRTPIHSISHSLDSQELYNFKFLKITHAFSFLSHKIGCKKWNGQLHFYSQNWPVKILIFFFFSCQNRVPPFFFFKLLLSSFSSSSISTQ